MRGAILGLLLVALPLAAADVPPPAAPPFGEDLSSPHQAVVRVDTQPARGVLSILGGGPQPVATLRALKASPTMARALAAEGASADDFFGRLVGAAAGTPDPLLSSYVSRSGVWGHILDGFDAEGSGLFGLEARRVLSLLPPEPRLTPHLTLVPFFAVSGFSEVATSVEGDEWTFVADLPRIAGDGLESAPPREMTLKTIRATGAVAWRTIFLSRFGTGAAFREAAPDVESLLVRTVLEGPPMLFLIPDEFYPLDALFEEPIARAIARWSAAVESLADPKKKESERSEILARTSTGDFWTRSAGAVGAVMTDAILRRAGRAAYLKALARGPRAVVALWLETTKGTKLPQPGKAARRELEKRVSGSGGEEKS